MKKSNRETFAKWMIRGELPTFDPSAGDLTPDQLHNLTEDLWSATSADERFTIDVGWTPEASPSGRFRCRLVEHQQWETPIEDVSLTALVEVQQWIALTIADCEGLMGTPGNLAPETPGTEALIAALSLGLAFHALIRPTADATRLDTEWFAADFLASKDEDARKRIEVAEQERTLSRETLDVNLAA